MIISCDHCHKKFEIDSNLIPKDGRLLECGSCNHKWFYKQVSKDKTKKIINEPQLENITEESIDEPQLENITEESIDEPQLKNIEEKNIDPTQTNVFKTDKLDSSIENKKIKKIGVLNVIIVFIISFLALIIIIETFKDPISIFIPNIKFVLNSLHETIRDIFLFSKDLIK